MSRRRSSASPDQMDLFVALAVDVPLRDQRDTMERPFFSLSKTPRTKPIIYAVGDAEVTVRAPEDVGIATIWDADILIWAASQITEGLNRGMPVSPVLQAPAYQILRAIRRPTGGEDYGRLRDGLRRLNATYVETTIRSKGKPTGFTWLSRWTEDPQPDGRSLFTIELPGWFFEGVVKEGGVLRIDERYFDLTGGIERWMYRVARKHAGNQSAGWSLTMKALYQKSGSTQRSSDFARQVRAVVAANELPQYWFTLSKEGGEETVHMVRRSYLAPDHPGYERGGDSADHPQALSTGVSG